MPRRAALPKLQQLNVRLPIELSDALDALGFVTDQSSAEIVRQLIEAQVPVWEREYPLFAQARILRSKARESALAETGATVTEIPRSGDGL